jgi:hypothetical protein
MQIVTAEVAWVKRRTIHKTRLNSYGTLTPSYRYAYNLFD